MEKVILVDQQDRVIGTCEKIEAHEKALLHRAFSIFLTNKKGEILLQRRALHKYHSGGLWANTCCGHPRPSEDIKAAAQRRLFEELGTHAELIHMLETCYKAPFDNGLTEHEYVHIFKGTYEGAFSPNPEEVMDTRWIDLDVLVQDMIENPETYVAWMRIYFLEHKAQLQKSLAPLERT